LKDEGKPEFEKSEPLQIQYSIDEGEAEDQDDSPIHHGTMVASKALGKKYGVAKGATLVSVKLRKPSKRINNDFNQGLELILENLLAKTERQSKSVVISSLGFGEGKDPKTDDDNATMKRLLKKLFDLGVPFVTSSGNLGNLKPNIHRLPKILEGPDVPIINVGAVTNFRELAFYSQGGTQLTVHAPGGLDTFKLTGQSKDSGIPRDDSGTSFGKSLHYPITWQLTNNFSCTPCCWSYRNVHGLRLRAMGRNEDQSSARPRDQEFHSKRCLELDRQLESQSYMERRDEG
jgi:hypothetical protein